jgi:phosphatidylglycerophosphate synthase
VAESPAEPLAARRPLKSRGSSTVRATAAWLAAHGVTPNAISAASMLFAALGGGAMLLAGLVVDSAAGQAALLVGAAGAIQLRLLCNLLDGLVAVEGGLRTPDGELFNEVPDRVSDAILLVAAGYAAQLPELGWAAALLAALTAYARALAGALSLPQDFCGPMAKPQRMALLTLACLVAAAGPEREALIAALAVVTAGSALTALRRLARARRLLAERS